MYQDTLIVGLEKQLDQADSVLNTFVVIAVISLLAGLSGADPIKAGGFEIPRRSAFLVLGMIFIFANILMLIIFVRIGSLLDEIDSVNMLKALSIVGLHKWIFNPFSYFGGSIVSRIASGTGFGCCIIIWWIGFSALQAVIPDDVSEYYLYQIISGIYLGVGLVSMITVNRVYLIIIKKSDEYSLDVSERIKSTQIERTIFAFMGIGVGGLVSFVAGSFQFLKM